MKERLFIAIPLSDAVRNTLEELQNQIEKDYGNIFRTLKSENMHLTLHFLGDVESDNISSLVNKLSEVIPKYNTFSLTLGNTGAFPSIKKPKVVWIGAESSGEELTLIHGGIKPVLENAGIETDSRPFRGHITIAYGRKNIPFKLLREGGRKLENLKWEGGHKISVKEILLYKSNLTPAGAIHTPLHTFQLKPEGHN